MTIFQSTCRLLAVNLLILFFVLFHPFGHAEQNETIQSMASTSVGYIKSQLSAQQKQNLIKQNQIKVLGDQLIGKTTNKKRPIITDSKPSLEQNAINNSQVVSTSHPVHYQFGIYEALTLLFDDIDSDGYFQSFSVTFDADIVNQDNSHFASVYAELYLSKNDGPWIHYFTTDTFTLQGNSTEDAYEVITTLYNGYGSGSYDVLIDLYEVGFTDIVATYSALDSENLYDLPLESSDYDLPLVTHHHSVGHGGSMSVMGLILVVVCAVRRQKSFK